MSHPTCRRISPSAELSPWFRPRLGDWHVFAGNQYRVYTLRGWVILDTWRELDEELNEVESLTTEGRAACRLPDTH